MRIATTLPGSGTLGGVIANRSKTGPRLTARVSRTQPRTVQQTTLRARLGSAAATWRALTSAEQLAWTTLASVTPWKDRLGQKIGITGYALYVSVTIKALNNNYPPPPPAGTIIIEQEGTAIAAISGQTFEQDGTPIATP